MHDPIRLVLIALSVVLLAAGGYYRVQSQRGGEPLDRTKEGWPLLIGIRVAGLLIVVSTVAWFWNPARLRWTSLPLPDAVRWIGVVLFGCSVAWLVWMFHTLGPNLTDTVVTRQAHTLVTRGPYRWVRHPFYDSAGLMVLGVALMAANWFLMLGGLVFMILIVIRTRTEEDKLLARFGDSYRTYMMQTGRFLPHVSPGGVRSWPDTTP